MRLRYLVALLALFACGDPSAPPGDASGIDAVTDSAMDASSRDRCEVLCQCMVQVCSEMLNPCMQVCGSLSESTRECRIDHCEFARLLSPATHCPHARGVPNAPGQVPNCI